MFCRISRFSARLGSEPSEAVKLLSRLADHGVDLLGMTVGEAGPDGAEITLFTTAPAALEKAARLESLTLDGPHPAILVQEGDRAGAFAAVLVRLAASGVRLTTVSAMSDGRGRFGCLVALPAADVARALGGLAKAA